MRVPGGSETDPNAYFQRIEQVTAAAFPSNAPGTTAGAVVDFWIGRIFGYPIEPTRREEVIKFLGQNPDPAQAAAVVLTWNNNWNSGNLGQHYTLARLRASVALLAMCPEFYQR